MTTVRIPTQVIAFAQRLRDVGLLYIRSVVIYRCDISGIPPRSPNAEVDFVVASDADLRRLAPLEGHQAARFLERRVRGNVCFLARSGSTDHGYVWLSRTAEPVTEANDAIDVSRDPAGAYLYNGYVLPESRRKGVLGVLLAESKRWAALHGITRLYASVARDNYISERALQTAGFVTPVGGVTLVRVLDREWKRVWQANGKVAIDVVGIERRLDPRPVR